MNLISLMYLFFRLAPFIIVSFFVLGSLINGEIKGLIFLVGLCFSMVITYLISNMLKEEQENKHLMCDAFSMNSVINNKFPIGLAIICHTFFYLVFPIAKYRLEIYNIPVLIGFPLLIIAEFVWNTKYNCFGAMQCIGTIIVSGGLGVAYSAMIDSLNLPRLLHTSAGSDRQMCNKPSNQKFRCYAKKAT